MVEMLIERECYKCGKVKMVEQFDGKHTKEWLSCEDCDPYSLKNLGWTKKSS